VLVISDAAGIWILCVFVWGQRADLGLAGRRAEMCGGEGLDGCDEHRDREIAARRKTWTYGRGGRAS